MIEMGGLLGVTHEKFNMVGTLQWEEIGILGCHAMT
jgi:hypothetical protein